MQRDWMISSSPARRVLRNTASRLAEYTKAAVDFALARPGAVDVAGVVAPLGVCSITLSMILARNDRNRFCITGTEPSPGVAPVLTSATSAPRENGPP